MTTPDTVEEVSERLMDMARYFYYLQRQAEQKVQSVRSPEAQRTYDVEASVFASAAETAREMARWVEGEREDPPLAIEVGAATAAQTEESDEDLSDATDIDIEGEDEEDD